MQISVVIPSFNRREVLSRAVRSVMEQTFSAWELIVVDDGSEDESWKVVQETRDARVNYVYQKHRGVSAARNLGMRLARGDWIAFLDSDDYWQPGKLERQLEALRHRPHYRVIYTDEIWIRRGRRVNPKKIHRKYSGWIYHRCLPLCIISPSSVMLHKSVFDEVGAFDETYPVCEDYELWLRVAARHPVFFLEEPLIVKTGGHSDQLSHSLWGLDRYRVQALIKTCNAGNLTPQQKLWTAQEIVRKASILEQGFANRGKPQEARFYGALGKTWEVCSVEA